METGLVPANMTWYKEFSELHDNTIRKGQKPRNGVIKFIYFIMIMIFIGFLIFMIKCMVNDSKPYRTSSKYKKVIKEGVFFDTIEYHEQ